MIKKFDSTSDKYVLSVYDEKSNKDIVLEPFESKEFEIHDFTNAMKAPPESSTESLPTHIDQDAWDIGDGTVYKMWTPEEIERLDKVLKYLMENYRKEN